MITSGTRTGSTEQGLANAASKVFSGLIDTTTVLIESLKANIPTDAEFLQAFEIATVNNHRFARYYLRSLEMAAKGEPEPWHIPNDDNASINLEHVLPQKPEGHWPQFDADQAKLFCKRLGNMVLMQKSQNTNMQNLGFANKRGSLGGSPYNLTNQIGVLLDWNPSQIVNRQKVLAKIALQAWPI